MAKPFIREAENGNKTSMSAEEVYFLGSDQSAGTRLAVALHDNGVLTDEQFLDVLRPGRCWNVRPRGEFDGE